MKTIFFHLESEKDLFSFVEKRNVKIEMVQEYIKKRIFRLFVAIDGQWLSREIVFNDLLSV